MFARLLLLMTVVPALELYLLIHIGGLLGPAQTVLLIIVTGAAGAALAKREGIGVIRQLQQDTLSGLPPANRLVEGILVLVGGVLLITPGVLTDLLGFALIIPLTRRWLAPRVKDQVARRVTGMPGVRFEAPRAGPAVEQTRDHFRHPIA